MSLPPEDAWYVVISSSEDPHTKTVKGLDAVEAAINEFMYGGDMPKDVRESWHESLLDFDGHWSGHYPEYMPWEYCESFEDGSITVQRLSDDDPAVAALSPIRTQEKS